MLNNYFKTVTANEELSIQGEALIISYMINYSCSFTAAVGDDLFNYLRDLIKEHAPELLEFYAISDHHAFLEIYQAPSIPAFTLAHSPLPCFAFDPMNLGMPYVKEASPEVRVVDSLKEAGEAPWVY
jgi:hypothetical protein